MVPLQSSLSMDQTSIQDTCMAALLLLDCLQRKASVTSWQWRFSLLSSHSFFFLHPSSRELMATLVHQNTSCIHGCQQERFADFKPTCSFWFLIKNSSSGPKVFPLI